MHTSTLTLPKREGLNKLELNCEGVPKHISSLNPCDPQDVDCSEL